MESLMQEPGKGGGNKKLLLVAIVAGALLVAAVVGIASLKPSSKQVEQNAMEGAYREGSPEFASYTRKIIIRTDEDRTTQSPTGLGTITMSVGGVIRNITGKTITGLEVKVDVVDMQGKTVKDKSMTVVPSQAQILGNNEELRVQVVVDGFKKDDDRANVKWKVTAIKVE